MIEVKSLTDEELASSITSRLERERTATADIVTILAEMETRRLYLKLGFSSLFDLATNGFGYSSSAALRRIKAARLARVDPSIPAKLESGELNFATIDVLSNFSKQPELKSLTQEICGRSREEAEQIVAHLRPLRRSTVRDSVKPVVITPKNEDLPVLPFNPDENTNNLRTNPHREHQKREVFGSKPGEKFHLSFTMNRAEKELLDRTRQLMFAGNAEEIGFGRVIGKVLKFYLEHHCPKERQQKREARLKRKEARPEAVKVSLPASPRYVSLALRDQILARDGYRCSYMSAEGRRCGCTVDLEIDHILPVGRGGRTEQENLRVLCRAHNLERAYEVYGEKYVRRRIAAARVRV